MFRAARFAVSARLLRKSDYGETGDVTLNKYFQTKRLVCWLTQRQSGSFRFAHIAALFCGGNIVSLALRMTGGLLTTRLVEPQTLGLFNGIGLVLAYAPFLQLGILTGLNRELPYFIGAGDRRRADQMAASAQAWALCVGSVVAGGLFLGAAWYSEKGRWEYSAGLATNGLLGFLFFYSQNSLQTTYRTSHEFAKIAIANVASNFANLALVPIVVLLGFYGLCLRALLAAALNAQLLWRWRPFRIKPAWNRGHLTDLLKVGAPIFGVALVWSWWTAMDSTLVLKYMGTRGLGLYSLSLMAGSAISLLPTSVAQMVYPRMAEAYGRSGNIREVLTIAQRPTIFLVAIMMPIALACWHVLPVMAPVLLPRYTAGIRAAQWSLVCASVLAVDVPVILFAVVKRQDLYGVATLAGVGTYFGSLQVLSRHGRYLAAFPQAMTTGYGVFLLLSYTFMYCLVRRGVNWRPWTTMVPRSKLIVADGGAE